MEREGFSNAKSHLLEKKFVWGWCSVRMSENGPSSVLLPPDGSERDNALLDVSWRVQHTHGIRMRSVRTESKPPSWLFTVDKLVSTVINHWFGGHSGCRGGFGGYVGPRIRVSAVIAIVGRTPTLGLSDSRSSL